MADMTPLADVLNGDPADATDVQNNFQIIEAYVNGTSLVRTDGTEVMAADLDMDGNTLTNISGLAMNATKITGLADGTADADAVNFGQLTQADSPLPLGTVGYAEITTDSVSVTALTVITGLSITFTAVSGRRYRATAQGEIYQSVGTDAYSFNIDNTSVGLTRAYGTNGSTTAFTRHIQYVNDASISGSTTWRVSLERVAGTGNITVGAAAARPAFILIEDIGAL